MAGALFGEIVQQALYAHADTHLDPPTASIVVTTFLIGMLVIGGVFSNPVWLPIPW